MLSYINSKFVPILRQISSMQPSVIRNGSYVYLARNESTKEAVHCSTQAASILKSIICMVRFNQGECGRVDHIL